MNEQTLRSILSRVGVHPGRPHVKLDRKTGEAATWVDFMCPLAPWTHTNGRDSRPSAGAVANEHGQSNWKCHTCKAHGKISTLVADLQKYRGTVYPGLVREAEEADIHSETNFTAPDFEDGPVGSMARPEPLEEAQYEGLYRKASEVPEALTYLTSRGVSAETADKLGLLWDDAIEQVNGQPARQSRRIMFPVRGRHGELYGFSGRAIDGDAKPKIKDYFGLPKRYLVLGAERWVEHRPILIVEGLFGYASLIEQGADKVCNVGAILGSEMTPEKAEFLKETGEAVFLLLDNDEAGDAGTFGRLRPDLAGEMQREEETGAVFKLQGHVPLFLPAWPEGKVDPDELTFEDVEEMVRETPLHVTTKVLTKNQRGVRIASTIEVPDMGGWDV